jgi:hypothetical protein
MDSKAQDFIEGQIVIASDSIYGTYIGSYVSKHQLVATAVKVQILACTVYPYQSTIFYAHIPFERRPYVHSSVETFEAANVEPYEGPIPEYRESVIKALHQAIEKAREQGNINTAVKLRNHLSDTA